jgi:methionyl-tRNA formyltransferase
MLRTLFFGSSAFAVPSFEVVVARTDLCGVVTQPDRPAGRGRNLQPTAVKLAAAQLGVRVYEPLKLHEFAATIASQPFDLFVLASYGKILPQALLDLPRLGALNVHPSLLPAYRGATPIQAALRNGDAQTGVSVMLMDGGMDTGPIVLQRAVAIAPGETYGELHDRLAQAGAELLQLAIDLAERGDVPSELQRGPVSTTRPLRKEDLQLDWSWTAEHIVNAIRALSPQPGARAPIRKESVKILRARALPDAPNLPIGELFAVAGAAMVRCGDGAIALDEVIAPNHGRESGAAYLSRLGAHRTLDG